MSNIDRGYKLADGSYSSDYSEGDKFVVVSLENASSGLKDHREGTVVELWQNDNTPCPAFRDHEDDHAYINWEDLKAYKEDKSNKDNKLEELNLDSMLSYRVIDPSIEDVEDSDIVITLDGTVFTSDVYYNNSHPCVVLRIDFSKELDKLKESHVKEYTMEELESIVGHKFKVKES